MGLWWEMVWPGTFLLFQLVAWPIPDALAFPLSSPCPNLFSLKPSDPRKACPESGVVGHYPLLHNLPPNPHASQLCHSLG